jgi:hypothetical protein
MARRFLCALLLFASLSVAIAASDREYFNQFIHKYERKYREGTSEYEYRFQAFQVFVQEVNPQYHD